MDETTPHMHFAFIPVVPDKKKQGRFKVSAKERINRFELSSFHFELEQALSTALGHSVGILNGATKDGNKSVTRLKRESQILAQREAEHQEQVAKTRIQYAEQRERAATERIDKAWQRTVAAEERAKFEEGEVIRHQNTWISVKKQTNELWEQQQKIKQNIAALEKQLKEAQNLKEQEIMRITEELAIRLAEMDTQIKAAESRLAELQGQILTAEQVKDIGIKKAPFGMALIPYQDALNLKRTAERVDQSDDIINRKYEILSDARKRAEEITKNANKELEETEHLLELRLSEVEELTNTIHTLIHVRNIIEDLAEEERKRGIDREKLLKKADTIRKNYEQSKQQNSSEQSQNQTTSRRIRR